MTNDRDPLTFTVGPFTASIDCRTLIANGQTYYFNEKQAEVIDVLLDAYRDGVEIATTTLCDQAGTANGKLGDTFRVGSGKNRKPHPAWNTLIVKGRTEGSITLIAKRAADMTTRSTF